MSPAYPAFSLFSCPLSPHPPSPVGKGETKSLFRRGLRPRHPCIRPFAALTETAKQVPSGGLAPPALPVRRALAAPCGGLNPRGTGYPCRCGARRGAEPARHWLFLPSRYSQGGACPLCRLPTMPLALLLPPIPPTPFPGGEGGGTISLFRRGLRPRHPCIRPFAAFTEPAKQVLAGGACPLCRPPTPPLACFPSPYPPSPLPRRGRGD